MGDGKRQTCDTFQKRTYCRKVDLSSGNVQRSALVVVAYVNVHACLDVAPHQGHVTIKDALAQHVRNLPVSLIQAASNTIASARSCMDHAPELMPGDYGSCLAINT